MLLLPLFWMAHDILCVTFKMTMVGAGPGQVLVIDVL